MDNTTIQLTARMQSEIIRDQQRKISDLNYIVRELSKENEKLRAEIADYEAQELISAKRRVINVQIL